MPRPLVVIVALGFFVLALGLFIPSVIDAEQETTRAAFELNTSETETVDGLVDFTLDDVNETAGTVNVTVRDNATQEEATITGLNTSVDQTVTPADDPVTVNLVEIEPSQTGSDSSEATLLPSFAWTYGWNDGAVTFADNIDLMLVLLGLIMMLAPLLSVVNL